MKTFPDGSITYEYAYNGLGDRLQQIHIGKSTTRYTLDLNAGLSQVLSDGTNTYLYGYGRVAQDGANSTEYSLPDALGSVRQMADTSGEIILSQSFTPYGKPLARVGIGSTAYDFAGEWTDPSGLQYLRARYYAPGTGTFISRDPWSGNVRQPSSLNRYLYVQGNPMNFSDPSGLCRNGDKECWNKANDIWNKYRIWLETEGVFDELDVKLKALSDFRALNLDNCILGFPMQNPLSIIPSHYWLINELNSIDSILAIFKDFLSRSKTGYFNTLGNGRITIRKVFRNYDENRVPNGVPVTLPPEHHGTYLASTIQMPVEALGEGNVQDFGATLSHELMHTFDYSFYNDSQFSPSLDLTSQNTFWQDTSRINYYNFGTQVLCGGPTNYSCQDGAENFAESAAIYILDWAATNGSTSDIQRNSSDILNTYKDVLYPGKPPALRPGQWQDNGLRKNWLDNFFFGQ